MDKQVMVLSVLIVVCAVLAASLIIMLVLVFMTNSADRNLRKGMGICHGKWLDAIAETNGLHRKLFESDSAMAFRALNETEERGH